MSSTKHRSAGSVRRRLWLPIAGVVLALGTALAAATLPSTDEPGTGPAMTYEATAVAATAADTPDVIVRPDSFADVIARVKPAVVNISTARTAARNPFEGQPSFPPGSPFEEFFRRFFDRPGGAAPGPRLQSAGSGFIVDSSGIVVTNYHVVERAEEINVVLDDGSLYPAQVKGVDPKTDLAVLEIEGDGGPFPAVAFGDSEAARVGDWVIAIGNPFGFGNTATTGIVSARGRDIQAGPFDDFIQIDAPINSGNSGGPLFDISGRVIGVNTAIFSPNGGNVGIGFAIPADLAAPIVDQLRSQGRVERGWLGVSIQPLDEEIAGTLGRKSTEGALVAEVVADSPAEAAGVRAGDLILAFDGKPVSDIKDLTRLAADAEVGSRVELEVWRNGRKRELDLRVGSSPGDEPAAAAAPPATAQGKLGLSLAPLDAQARQRLGLDDELEGVLITAVTPGSPAATKGLRPGDVVVAAGDTEVTSPGELAEAIEKVRKSESSSVLLRVVRRGVYSYVALPLAK